MAALGDLTRVDTPNPLLRDLGRMPSEDSTGDHRRQGAITNTGHAHARRALIAGTWASRDPAKVRRPLPWRPPPIQATRWTAPGRLCTCDRQLIARGTHANRFVVAIARALRVLM
jgi:hypothetical protein